MGESMAVDRSPAVWIATLGRSAIAGALALLFGVGAVGIAVVALVAIVAPIIVQLLYAGGGRDDQ